MELVEKAKQFATRAHGDQKYGNDKPYTWHLEKTAEFARRLGYADEVVAACWLHDTAEDTSVTLDELRAEFPAVVVDAVAAVTFTGASGEDKLAKALSPPIGHVVKGCDATGKYSATVIYGAPAGKDQWEFSIHRYLSYLEVLKQHLPTPQEIQDFLSGQH